MVRRPDSAAMEILTGFHGHARKAWSAAVVAGQCGHMLCFGVQEEFAFEARIDLRRVWLGKEDGMENEN